MTTSGDVLQAWATPSTHGAAIYETVLYRDGSLSCNCPGWVYPRKGRPRACRHTRDVAPLAAEIMAGRVHPEATGRPAPARPGPRPRSAAAVSQLTGRPLRRFDLS